MTQLAANPDRRIDMTPLVIHGRTDHTRKSEGAGNQTSSSDAARPRSIDSFTSVRSEARARSSGSVPPQLAAPSPRIGASLRASATKRQSPEPAATREHPPSKELTREQRVQLAAEALRAGDRDRAVALLNENTAEKGAVVASLAGINFALGAVAYLLPIPTMVVGMGAGFESCEQSDVSVALLVAAARAGGGPLSKARAATTTRSAAIAGSSAGAAERMITLGKGVRVPAATFHSRIKPEILADVGKQLGGFQKRVGKNPDIEVVRGKINLRGTGPFKGQTVNTDLRASDYLDID